MNQETRSLLAIGLSVLVMIMWYSFFAPKPPPKNAAEKQQAVTIVDGGTSEAVQQITPLSPSKSSMDDPQKSIPIKKTSIESDLYKVELTNAGGAPVTWQMKKFENINLSVADIPPLAEKFSFAGIPDQTTYNLLESTTSKVVYGWRSKDYSITKTYQFKPSEYAAELTISIRNLSNSLKEGKITLGWPRMLPKEEEHGFFGFLKGPQNTFNPVYYMGGKVGREPVTASDGKVLWAGIEDRYFISAIIPREQMDGRGLSATR